MTLNSYLARVLVFRLVRISSMCVCVGMQMGLYAFEMTLAHLLHCFNWELPNGMKPSDIDMNDVFGLTVPKATRLVAVPTPRLLCQLY